MKMLVTNAWSMFWLIWTQNCTWKMNTLGAANMNTGVKRHNYYLHHPDIHSFYSFSVNPAGSTNSCGGGNCPSLQYNKNKNSITYSNTKQNIEYNSSVLQEHSNCHKINHHLYESMSVIKSHSYKNNLQNYEP
jgi:hypothetical protein